jgi:hypothetical protein
MKTICITGGDAQTRLACATRVGRALLTGGRTAALVSQWNRLGDPDPYQSSPFSELALVSAEAGLSYVRPGMKLETVLSSVRSDWLIADGIELPGAPRIACGPDAVDESTLAVFGFDSGEGLPPLPAHDTELSSFLLEAVEESCASCDKPCPAGSGTAGNITVRINGSLLDLGSFPGRVLESTLEGLLSAFKGYESSGDIEVVIRRH